MFVLARHPAHAAMEDIRLSEQDRILVLAPHPDDEVLGTGGILLRAAAMKLPVKVVFFTHGDSNQWSFLVYRRHFVFMPGAVKKMGLVRQGEAVGASSILGVNRGDVIFLGYPDFGTMNIWHSRWDQRPPLTSILTRVTKVPYAEAYRPGALHKGDNIVEDLRAVIRDFKPTKIFVSHPADHNGDHVALYLFSKVAVWDQKWEDQVQVFPYLVHYSSWPRPEGFHPNSVLSPPALLKDVIPWKQHHLTGPELDLKKSALQSHRSQYMATPRYLLSFIRPNEIFGDFPVIDLPIHGQATVFSTKRNVVSRLRVPQESGRTQTSSVVAMEWTYRREERENLLISITLSKPMARNMEATVYFFGYKKGVAFEKMPKISVRLGVLGYNVFDQVRRLNRSLVEVKRGWDVVSIRVPLNLLGWPDRILTSAGTNVGKVPFEGASWKTLELNTRGEAP